MQISGASMSDALAGTATRMNAEQVQTQIAAHLIKNIQDQQDAAAQALIRMMEQSVDGVGSILDLRA